MTEQAPNSNGPPAKSPYEPRSTIPKGLPRLDIKDLRAAQRDPELRRLLLDAEEEDRRLERDGRIHR